MPPNIFHAQDADMFGRNKVQKFQAEFDARCSEPETVLLQAQWQKYPPEMQAQMLSMMDPEMRAIMEGFNGNKLAK